MYLSCHTHQTIDQYRGILVDVLHQNARHLSIKSQTNIPLYWSISNDIFTRRGKLNKE
jgi:hypothetical protein